MYIFVVGLGGIGQNLARIAVSEKHGDDVIIPEGSTVINEGDSVYVFVRRNLVDLIFHLFSVGTLGK